MELRVSTTAPPAVASATPRAPIRTIVVVCVPMFLVLLDVNIVYVALPRIGTGFGVSARVWSWVVDCYTLPLAVVLLAGGRLTDRFGYRAMLAAGEGVFLAGSLGCAFASSWAMLLAARTVQGLGAAAMLPASLAALTSLWQDRTAQAKALGVWSSVSASATALGPVIGVLLISWADWRFVFAINIPLCAMALFGVTALEHVPTTVDQRSRRVLPRSLAGATAAAFLMTAVGNGVLIAVTIYAQHALDMSALLTGLLMLTAMVPFVALGPVTGRLMHRAGRRAVASVGFGTGAVAILSLTRAGPGAGVTWIVLALLGVGIGLGLMTASIVGEGMEALPATPGLAGGINNTARQLGTSFGVAVSGATVGSQAHLVTAVHHVGLLAAATWVVGMVVTAIFFRRSIRKRNTVQS